MINFLKPTLAVLASALLFACIREDKPSLLDHAQLAITYFQEDAQWYLDNIPFFECSDQQFEQVYYYRWKLYKAHIRSVGDSGHVITEFINHVPWDREPFCTINAASMHHIYEGRWLRDTRYMDGYINYLYQNGGNNRRYSESVADATYARYLVDGDAAFITQQLDSMKKVYTGWDDHWEEAKKMYFIPAMPDATEYTIASIDASGGKDGFEGGEAFRPTINSYQYANARAIARIAALKGDQSTGEEFAQKATHLKRQVEQQLWNESLQHFTDRFKVDNQYVHYWDFIRGRELAGFAPWYFNLPSDKQKYHSAWKHLTDTTRLLGPFGFRTNEPSYQYYFHQFLYHEGKRGSQWNGPSWPYQTSQTLTGMANFLHNYQQNTLSKADYVHSLRLFTRQHYLPDGKINLVENYDPNLGGPIVYFYWSNHYLHSTYNNLIISGLCGILPAEGDTLDINPLVDHSIQYFCLDKLKYHGHNLTVIYDRDGKKYQQGKGLMVWVDGKKAKVWQKNGKSQVRVGTPVVEAPKKSPHNFALNLAQKGFPTPSASINAKPDSLYPAVDGRIWYFAEIRNRWTSLGSKAKEDWYALDLGQAKAISSIKIYLVADGDRFGVPENFGIEYHNGQEWLPVKMKEQGVKLIGNTENTLRFDLVKTRQIRIKFGHQNKQIALSELECF